MKSYLCLAGLQYFYVFDNLIRQRTTSLSVPVLCATPFKLSKDVTVNSFSCFYLGHTQFPTVNFLSLEPDFHLRIIHLVCRPKLADIFTGILRLVLPFFMWYQETGISPLQNARGLKKQQKCWMKNLGLLVSEPIAIRFIVLLF